MIFLMTRSRLVRYGRPAMIFSAQAEPTPGSASSWSLVAELMSSFSPTAAAALEALALIEESVLDCAPAVPAIPRARATAKNAQNNIREKVFMTTPSVDSIRPLRVNSPLFDGVSHAINGQHV